MEENLKFMNYRWNSMVSYGTPATIVAALLACPLALGAAEVTVVNTSDIVNGNTSSIAALKADPGTDGISYREALIAANNDSGSNKIGFDIPQGDTGYDPGSGRWILKPLTPYPPVTVGSLIIDGYAQTEARGDTNPDGPEIAFFGPAGPGAPCLGFASDGNALKMVEMADFPLGIHVVGDNNIVGPANLIRNNSLGIIVEGDGNLVRDNQQISDGANAGISVQGGRDNVITGNPISNNNAGIVVSNSASGNTVGPANEIVGNSFGVVVRDASLYNTITRNTIYDNREMGISLHGGGNAETAPPQIRYFGNVVRGSAPPGSTVEVYSDEESDGERYPGTQGRDYLGSVIADAGGGFGLVIPKAPRFVNATATLADGNSSAFSPPSRPLLVVSNSGTDSEPGDTVSFVNALAFATRETVRVGRRPEGIAGSRTGQIHVVNNDDDTVTIIFDPVDTSIAATVPVGVEPLAIVGDERFLYVVNTGSDPENFPGTLSVIDFSILSVVGTLPLGRRPSTVRPIEIGGELLLAVPNLYDDTVTFIDRQALSVVRTLTAGDYPSDICFGRDGLVYVTNIGNGSTDGVSVIDYASGRTLAKVFTGLGPISIDRTPGSPYVAVANSVSGTISVVDEDSGRILKNIPVDGVPTHVKMVKDKYIYATNFTSSLTGPTGRITVISLDTLSVIGSIDVGPFPNFIEVLAGSEENWFPNGADLAASPSLVNPGEGVTLGWVISPGLRERGDVLLGVETPDGTIMAFNATRTRLSPAGAVGSIARVAHGFSLSVPAFGHLDFPVPAGAPPGAYSFIAAILDPGTNSVAQVARSNGFTISP